MYETRAMHMSEIECKMLTRTLIAVRLGVCNQIMLRRALGDEVFKNRCSSAT